MPGKDNEPTYSDMKASIEAGNLVTFKGRTAATIAELDFIKGLPDASSETQTMTYTHGEGETIYGSAGQDTIGQKAQAFSAEYVAASKSLTDVVQGTGPTDVTGVSTAETAGTPKK